MASTTITQSVRAKFDDAIGSGLTDFDGSDGLWFGEVPQQLVLPFAGFVHNGERSEYTTEREYFDKGSFTFTIFAEGVAEVERLALLVLAVYDLFVKSPRLLDFTNGKVIEWDRTSYIVAMEPVADKNAARVARVDIQYAYRTQKTLPA